MDWVRGKCEGYSEECGVIWNKFVKKLCINEGVCQNDLTVRWGYSEGAVIDSCNSVQLRKHFIIVSEPLVKVF